MRSGELTTDELIEVLVKSVGERLDKKGVLHGDLTNWVGSVDKSEDDLKIELQGLFDKEIFCPKKKGEDSFCSRSGDFNRAMTAHRRRGCDMQLCSDFVSRWLCYLSCCVRQPRDPDAHAQTQSLAEIQLQQRKRSSGYTRLTNSATLSEESRLTRTDILNLILNYDRLCSTSSGKFEHEDWCERGQEDEIQENTVTMAQNLYVSLCDFVDDEISRRVDLYVPIKDDLPSAAQVAGKVPSTDYLKL